MNIILTCLLVSLTVGSIQADTDPFAVSAYDENEKRCLKEGKFLYDGQCVEVGTEGVCSSDKWMVLDEVTDETEKLSVSCEKKTCGDGASPACDEKNRVARHLVDSRSCRVDDKKNCRVPVKLVPESEEQYLTRLRAQVRIKRVRRTSTTPAE